MRIPLAATLLLVSISSVSRAAYLSFDDPNICSDSLTGSGPMVACTAQKAINQQYGDSANVDVTYSYYGTGSGNSILFWPNGWVGFPNAAAYGLSPTIDIVPLNGTLLSGISFYLAPYLTDRTVDYVRVEEYGGGVLQDFGGQTLTTATAFAYNAPTSAGYRISFGSSTTIAINNIDVGSPDDVVPEPATAGIVGAVLIAGLFATRSAKLRRARS